jgi:hypothetical protein
LTREEIARRFGLERGHTVAASVSWLVDNGLAEYREQRVHAVEPSDKTWFHWKKAEKEWYNAIQYHEEVVRDPGADHALTAIENSVLWLWNSWATSHIIPSLSGIGKQLRLDKRTVRKAVKGLQGRGFLDASKKINREAIEAQAGLWRDIPAADDLSLPSVVTRPSDWEMAEKIVSQQEWEKYRPVFLISDDPSVVNPHFPTALIDLIARHIAQMRTANYGDDEIMQVYQYIYGNAGHGDVCERAILKVFRIHEFVEGETSHNRDLSKFAGRNSHGLFMVVLAGVLADLVHLRKRFGRVGVCDWEVSNGQFGRYLKSAA